jgi:hypothetical protein
MEGGRDVSGERHDEGKGRVRVREGKVWGEPKVFPWFFYYLGAIYGPKPRQT